MSAAPENASSYDPRAVESAAQAFWDGSRAFEVVDPAAYRPALSAFTLISALENHVGPALWEFPGTRPDFYAQLWGTRTPAPPWASFEIRQSLY